ncbi:8587_t:CDS:2, partial [Paraglomus brasilianum]
MNLYAEIARLDDLEQDKKDGLFVYFAKNPGVKEEAIAALPECKDDAAKVRFLRGLLPEPATVSGEKRKYEEVKDASNHVVEALRKRSSIQLPDASELHGIITQPLPQELKIPILQHEFNTFLSNDYQNPCLHDDLQTIFQVSDSNTAIALSYNVLSAAIIGNPPSNVMTEYNFVSFWDANIRKFIEAYFPTGITIRNSSQHMSTSGKRPDFGFIINTVCPFRGEEKAPNNPENPRAELVNKIDWTYDPVPYVIGYYAIGTILTYAAICRPRPRRNKPDVVTILTLDLRERRQRVKNLLVLINLCPIIEQVQKVIGYRELPEFIPIERDDKIIEVCGTNVKKTYTGPNCATRIRKLKNIYERLKVKNVPNVDNLVLAYSDKNHGCVAYLEPKGI